MNIKFCWRLDFN